MARNCCPPGGTELCVETDIGVSRCIGEEAADDCLEDGEECSFDEECCGGYCVPNEDGVLVCGSECVELLGACTADSDCCDSLSCIDGLCQPSSTDCLPYASECEDDEDCCTGFCDPAAGLCLTPLT